jgi:DNA-binding FadR family transcriptional regulator
MARCTEASQQNPELTATLRQIVEALRVESLRCAEGELIGSEDELVARHRVSRPTLRHAAGLVAQEQLLQIRRGAKGGYIARRPTSRATAHMAAIFLRSREARLDELTWSTGPIWVGLARLAAANLDEASRQAFQNFLQREAKANVDGAGFRAFTKSEREFGQLLGAASHNLLLALFLDIIYDLAANTPPENDIFLRRPERVRVYRQQRTRLIEAILDGDPNVAEFLANRMHELTRLWREESGRPRSRTSPQQHDSA